jgi:peroxiredoxin
LPFRTCRSGIRTSEYDKETDMSLKAELDAVMNQFLATAPAEVTQTLSGFIHRLVERGVAGQAVTTGDQAPDFALPNVHGTDVGLSACLKQGPAVISFYRGGWCPFCNLELRAYQQVLPEIKAQGATLIAISPETPDGSLSTAEKHGLEFEVLSDSGNAVAADYGLVFEVEPAVRDLYASLGAMLPKANGDDSWTLPVPATYVVDTDGTIVWANVNANYVARAEPMEVVKVLRRITAGAATPKASTAADHTRSS